MVVEFEWENILKIIEDFLYQSNEIHTLVHIDFWAVYQESS